MWHVGGAGRGHPARDCSRAFSCVCVRSVQCEHCQRASPYGLTFVSYSPHDLLTPLPSALHCPHPRRRPHFCAAPRNPPRAPSGPARVRDKRALPHSPVHALCAASLTPLAGLLLPGCSSRSTLSSTWRIPSAPITPMTFRLFGLLLTLCSGQLTTFWYTGFNQTYIVPLSATTVLVQCWGGGGGGGNSAVGGSGSFISAVVSGLVPGANLTVVVGGAGSWTTVSRAAVFGGGGAVGSPGAIGCSTGGGRSAVAFSGTDIVTAAGGGGAGGYSSTSSGGAGGTPIGGSGAPGSAGYPGLGASQVAGGAGGTAQAPMGNAGALYRGGSVATGCSGCGAGGGGIYGGGSSCSYTSGSSGGGGGSSGACVLSSPFTCSAVELRDLTSSQHLLPGGVNASRGGLPRSAGGSGLCTLFVCPAGSFCPLGSQNASLCPGGHFCPAGTSSWANLNCGRGNYCPDGSSAPTPCPYQVPPSGGWGALQVQGPAFLVETAHCLNHCFWNFTSGDGMLSKC
jgi:hypothetical protein